MNDTNNKPPKSNKQIEQIEQIKPKLYNFMIIIIVIFFIILFLLLFNYLGKSNSQSIQTSPMNQLGSSIATPVVNSVINTTQSAANQLMEYQYPKPNKPSILGIILNLLYFILFVILILLFIKYAFNIDVLKAFKKKQDPPKVSSEKANKPNKAKNAKDAEEDEEDEDEDASNPNSIKTTIKNFSPKLPFKEVYHIPGNNYSYEEAKSVCKAYDGELANIKQMEDVYKKGGEWCSYGWSDNQLALFPTQHEHWNKLQTIKGHEHDCGRPGINGGYIDNPNVRFGVNCYGFKPKMKPIENKLMESASEYPITDQQVEFNKQVDHWKKNLNTIIVAPFNAKKWSGTEL